MELRQLPLRFRTAATDDGDDIEGVLEGYASVYDVEYRIDYNLKETIAPGAFDESIKAQGGVIPIFYAHDWSTLKSAVPQPPIGVGYVSSDKKGVRVRAELFMDDPKARSVWQSAKAGALREWSVGYSAKVVEFDEDDGELERVLEGELLEASVVLRGANPATEMVEVRSQSEESEGEAPVLLEDSWALLGRAEVRSTVMVQWDGSSDDESTEE